jgi:D-alanyl-D-alanine carboxypeptidase
MMDATYDRARDEADHDAARRHRRLRRRSGLRVPAIAILLSLLALAAPGAALAPLLATEPSVAPAARPADAVRQRRPPPPTPAAPLDGGIVVGADAAPRPADARRYQAALDEARARAGAFGVTFAIVRDGEIAWVGSSGETRERRPMAPGQPLVIGSITKTFIAAAVLQLVAEDRIRLDDPVREHLPALSWLSRRITVRQLLDHTSGLADVFNDETRVGLETDPSRAWTDAAVLATVGTAWYPPGEGWAYANTNYLLLTMLVEAVTGEAIGTVVATRLLAPLGLDSTAVLSGVDGQALPPAWSTIFRGSGAMVSSAADVARWGDALYAGSVLPEEQRRAMLRVNADDYGLGVQRIEISGFEGVGHTGLLNTDTSLLLHIPSRDVTIALLVNRTEVDLGLMLRAHPAPGEPSLLELAVAR